MVCIVEIYMTDTHGKDEHIKTYYVYELLPNVVKTICKIAYERDIGFHVTKCKNTVKMTIDLPEPLTLKITEYENTFLNEFADELIDMFNSE